MLVKRIGKSPKLRGGLEGRSPSEAKNLSGRDHDMITYPQDSGGAKMVLRQYLPYRSSVMMGKKVKRVTPSDPVVDPSSIAVVRESP